MNHVEYSIKIIDYIVRDCTSVHLYDIRITTFISVKLIIFSFAYTLYFSLCKVAN